MLKNMKTGTRLGFGFTMLAILIAITTAGNSSATSSRQSVRGAAASETLDAYFGKTKASNGPRDYYGKPKTSIALDGYLTQPKTSIAAVAVEPADVSGNPHNEKASGSSAKAIDYFPSSYVNQGHDGDGNVMTYEHG